jgi:thiamine pyrophosphokinase
VRAIIIAGGNAPDGDNWKHWLRDGDLIIGANGGAAQAHASGLLPDLIIGDLDSLPEEEQTALATLGCRFIPHPRAKDETDLELALSHAAKQGAREIVILGALGGRLDHTVANLLLLALPGLREASVRIVDGHQEAFVLHGGQVATLEGHPGDVVSLLPLGGDVHGVTTTGLAWALEGGSLRFGFSRGVSNEMVATTAHVGLENGCLLVVHGPPPGDG